jgi:ribosomal protein S6
MALQYELFYVVGDSHESTLPQIQEEVTKLVETQGGTWLEGEMIERRKLAYAIKKETRGTYIAKRFTLPNIDERKKTEKVASVAELSRQLELHKGVLRHVIVRAEGLPALGERETVPQIARPGRRDDRRGGDRRPDANQVREEAVDARLARKPEVAAVAAPVAREEVKVAEVKPVVEEKVEATAPKKIAKKEVVKTEKPVEEKAEEKEEAPKKRVTRKKKEVSIDEAEIDKKLDEVLNM